MMASRVGVVLIVAIVAGWTLAVPRASAQQTPAGIPARSAPSAPSQEKQGDSLADWIDRAQNLEVREALDQIGESWVQIMLVLAGVVTVILVASGVLRPGGFRAAGVRDVSPWPVPMWFFAGLLVFLAYPIAGGAAAEADWLFRGAEPTSFQREALSMAFGCLAATVVGIGVLFAMGKTAPDAGLKAGPMDLMVGLGGFLLAFPLIEVAGIGSAALFQQVTGQAPTPLAHETLRQIVSHRDDPWVWVLVGAVVVGVPIVEELVFRVGLQSAILRVTGSAWAGVIVTSLAFTALHWGTVPPDGWYAFGKLFVLSMALGIAFERTKKAGVPISMHMIFNGITVALALWGDPSIIDAGGTGAEPGAPTSSSTDVPAAGG